MKNLIFFALLFSFMTFNSASLQAQRPGKVVKVHKGPNHHQGSPSKRFYRNKVIVVKKRRGRVIQTLPAGHIIYVHRKINYYAHNGLYYNKVGNTYALVPSPFGLRIKVLPPNHRKIMIVGKPHFYYMGTYYVASNNEYEVVEPVIGAIVPDLPEENVEEITIEGEKLFEYDGYLYQSILENGEDQYKLVGKLEV